jgi:hypothetical protein
MAILQTNKEWLDGREEWKDKTNTSLLSSITSSFYARPGGLKQPQHLEAEYPNISRQRPRAGEL